MIIIIIGLFGPRIFTIVNIKQRPTTLTLSNATLAQALHVSCCISLTQRHGIKLFIAIAGVDEGARVDNIFVVYCICHISIIMK